ncbi:MAG: thioesterase family protein, partial [Planctomycetota bacterium]
TRHENHPEVPPSAQMRFRVRAHTRWSDEDNQGVLNNAVYMTLLEESRYAYFKLLDLLDDNQFPFLLAQTQIRFSKPGRGGAEVEIEVRTLRLGNSSLEQAYRVRSWPELVTWAEARATLVLYDPKSGSSRAMPERFRTAVAVLEGL